MPTETQETTTTMDIPKQIIKEIKHELNDIAKNIGKEGANTEERLRNMGAVLSTSSTGEPMERIRQLNRRLDAEVEKFVLTVNRIKSLKRAGKNYKEQLRVMTAYHRTCPASVIAAYMRVIYPKLAGRAFLQIAEATDLEPLRRCEELISFLTYDDEYSNVVNLDAVREELQRMADRKDVYHLIYFGIVQNEYDISCAVLALIAFTRRQEHIMDMLTVAAGSCMYTTGHIAAILAAQMDPEITLQRLGKMLADVAMEGPTLEGPAFEKSREQSEALAKTLIVARCIIPRIGSPLPPIKAEEMPPNIRPIVEWVDRVWEQWPLIVGNRKGSSNETSPVETDDDGCSKNDD